MFVSSVYSPARPHLQRTVYSALWSLSFSIFIIPCVICTQDPLVQLGFVSFVLNLVWQTFEDKWSHIETKQNCLVDIHLEASYSWSSGQNFFLDFCFILFKICLMITAFEGVHLLFPLNLVLYHLQCLHPKMWKFPLCSYHFPPSSPPSVFLSCEWRQWLRLRMGLCILLQNTAALVIHSTALLSSVHTPTQNGLMSDKLLVKNSSKWLTNNLTRCRKVVLNSISTFTLCLLLVCGDDISSSRNLILTAGSIFHVSCFAFIFLPKVDYLL